MIDTEHDPACAKLRSWAHGDDPNSLHFIVMGDRLLVDVRPSGQADPGPSVRLDAEDLVSLLDALTTMLNESLPLEAE